MQWRYAERRNRVNHISRHLEPAMMVHAIWNSYNRNRPKATPPASPGVASQPRGGARQKSQPSKPCMYCGTRHARLQCPAYGKQCANCGVFNNFDTICTFEPRSDKKIHQQQQRDINEKEADTVYENAVLIHRHHCDKDVQWLVRDAIAEQSEDKNAHPYRMCTEHRSIQCSRIITDIILSHHHSVWRLSVGKYGQLQLLTVNTRDPTRVEMWGGEFWRSANHPWTVWKRDIGTCQTSFHSEHRQPWHTESVLWFIYWYRLYTWRI